MALKSFSKSPQGSAPSFPRVLEDSFCCAGQDAVLECTVLGYPIPEVRWEKGGIQLATTRRLRTERQGDKCRLHIKSCTRLETGLFKCLASNKFGTASTSANVRFDAIPAKSTVSPKGDSLTNGSKLNVERRTEYKNGISENERNVSSAKTVPSPKGNHLTNGAKLQCEKLPESRTGTSVNGRQDVPEKIISPPKADSSANGTKLSPESNKEYRNAKNGAPPKDSLTPKTHPVANGSKVGSDEQTSRNGNANSENRGLIQRPNPAGNNNGTESFKGFQLRKVPKRSSFKKNTDTHVFHVPSLKKTLPPGIIKPALREDSKTSHNSVDSSIPSGKSSSNETKAHHVPSETSPISNRSLDIKGLRESKPNGVSSKEADTMNEKDRVTASETKSSPALPTPVSSSNGNRRSDNKETSVELRTNGNHRTSTKDSKSNLVTFASNKNIKPSSKESPASRLTSPTKQSPKDISRQAVEESSTRTPKDRKSVQSRQRKQAPKFVLSPKSKVVKEGETVKFMCSSTGNPDPKVTWKKRDVALCPSERFLCYQTDCMHFLEVRDIQLEDAGEYSATLENEVAQVHATAHLDVRAKKSTGTWPPRVIRPLSDVTVSDGCPCLLSCEVSGNPALTCSWSRSGQPLSPHPDFAESFDGQTATLSIREVFPDDQGDYVLSAENEVGRTDTSCTLTVRRLASSVLKEDGDAPTFTTKLIDLEAQDGSHVTLSVEVSGTEPMEIIWVHNESVVKDSPDFRYQASEDRTCHSLVIEEVFPEDAGVYFCEAYNLFGEDVTTCLLRVKGPSDPSDVTKDLVTSREKEISNCEPIDDLMISGRNQLQSEILVPALEDAKSAFRRSLKNKMESPPDDRHRSQLPNGTSPQLQSSPSPPVVTWSPGVIPSPSRRLSYAGSPRLSPAQILKGPRSLAVLRGETITLRCQFSGSPVPTVAWIKAGKILCGDDRTSLEVEEGLAVLTVRGAMADDSGKYVVALENSGGSDCQFASVSVEGVPEPPTDRPVVSDVTTHSLVLAWTGSPYDGGSVITGYAVEMCSLPELRWRRVSGACHSTCYTVRNLLPCRSYAFRVKAENVHGFSQASPESEPVFIADEDEDNDGSVFEDQKNIVIENGQSFLDQYDFMEVVGKGRFGIVHKCLERISGEIRAAKVIRCVKQKDKQKMREEVDIMNQLRHPKLLQLVAAFENPKDLILVMEYISGGELFERVIADDFVLLEKDCVLFLQQICEAVRYMHDNSIIHLDLKPENILCETKSSHQIKIIDFGLARKFSTTESIRVLFGTPEFVAPEVIAYEPVSPASDMWSVGVICYVLLTGLSPFMGDNDAETFANITRADYDFDDEAFDAVSNDAKDFINQLFAKRPEKRLSASGCLRHKWLAKDQNRCSVVQLNTDKLKRFIIRRKWQKTGNAIRALGRMVSLSSPSRSVSSRGSLSDSEHNLSLTSVHSNCGPAIPEDQVFLDEKKTELK